MTSTTPIPEITGNYAPAEEQAGALIAGRYRLLEKIGEGGMGEVWVAKQDEPVKRKIALKLIKQGMDSKSVLARFEQERQALAIMDHPHIAKVLDAGLTDDRRPFFAMELVNGLPLTRYCDEAKLDIRQRLALFVPVCQAVQHAHQKGIIHRDLKPSNILVTLYDGKPSPKVIDFGVAKAIGGQIADHTLTQFGGVVGTLEYMAPEQAAYSALDVDTRADIYSLGVLLYELLTGLKPFDGQRLQKAAYDEVVRILREEEPPRPSTRISSDRGGSELAAARQSEPKKLSTLMRGELDWIVMKCLEKDRNRRYETANGLARDLQRFLADEPVEARPPTLRYRAGKFLRRNRTAVSVAAGFALLLVAGLIGLIIGLARLNQANADIAESLEREKKAKLEARQALDELFSQATEEWLAGQHTLTGNQVDYLQRALARYELLAGDDATDRESRLAAAYAWARAGKIRLLFAQFREAETAIRRAMELMDGILADFPDDDDTLYGSMWVRNEMAYVLSARQDYAGTEQYFQETLERASRLYEQTQQARHGENASNALHNLAVVYSRQERYDEAEQAARKCLELRQRIEREHPHDADPAAVAAARGTLAVALNYLGRDQEADAEFAAAFETWRQLVEKNYGSKLFYRGFAITLQNWATLLEELKDFDKAENAYRTALPVAASLTEKFPSDPEMADLSALIRGNLGRLLNQRRRPAEALEQLRIAVRVRQRLADDFPENTGFRADLVKARLWLADTLHVLRDFGQAASALELAIKTLEGLLAAEPGNRTYTLRSAELYRDLSGALYEDGKRQEAEDAARRALELAQQVASDDGGDLAAQCAHRLAEVLVMQDKFTEAESILLAEWEERRSDPDARHFNLGGLCDSLAKVCFRKQDWEAAESWSTKAVEYFVQAREKSSDPINRRFLLEGHWHRAEARVKLGRHKEAVEDWDQTVALDDGGLDRPWFRAHRAFSLHQLGEKSRAKNELALAVRETQAILGQPNLGGLALYDAAAVYALAAAVLDDERLVDEHAAQAVKLLKQAADLGYFRDPAMLAALKQHDDYVSLREREDFRQLIEDIKAK